MTTICWPASRRELESAMAERDAVETEWLEAAAVLE